MPPPGCRREGSDKMAKNLHPLRSVLKRTDPDMVTAIVLSLALHGAILLLPPFSAAPSATANSKTAVHIRLSPVETTEIQTSAPETSKRPVITAPGGASNFRVATVPLTEAAPPAVNSPASPPAYSPVLPPVNEDDSTRSTVVQKGVSGSVVRAPSQKAVTDDSAVAVTPAATPAITPSASRTSDSTPAAAGIATTAIPSAASALHTPAAPQGNSPAAFNDSSPVSAACPRSTAQLDFSGKIAAVPPKGATIHSSLGTGHENTSADTKRDMTRLAADTSNNVQAQADAAIEPRMAADPATRLSGVAGPPAVSSVVSPVVSGEKAQNPSIVPPIFAHAPATGMEAEAGAQAGSKAGAGALGTSEATPGNRLSLKRNGYSPSYPPDSAGDTGGAANTAFGPDSLAGSGVSGGSAGSGVSNGRIAAGNLAGSGGAAGSPGGIGDSGGTGGGGAAGASSGAAHSVSESPLGAAAGQVAAGADVRASMGISAQAAGPAATHADGTLRTATKEAPGTGTEDKTSAIPGTPASQSSTRVISAQEIMDFLSGRLAAKKVYPKAAQQRHIEGKVRVGMSISADGSLISARVIEKSGSAILDRDALALVSGIFPLPLQPGKSMEVAVTIEYKLLQ